MSQGELGNVVKGTQRNRVEVRRGEWKRVDRLTELLERAREGDRTAFETLMAEARAKVFWRARQVLGDAGLADEVTTRAFAKAWKNRRRFNCRQASAATWLDKIVHRVALDAATQRQQERSHEVSAFEAAPNGSGDEAPARMDPQDEVEEAPPEEADVPLAGGLVGTALRQLKEKDRLVLELAYFEHLSYEQIAKRLGITVQAVGPRLTRARQHLVELLDPEALP
jgi:RNA polymerase sigma-70 factor (ECF subfamily)